MKYYYKLIKKENVFIYTIKNFLILKLNYLRNIINNI